MIRFHAQEEPAEATAREPGNVPPRESLLTKFLTLLFLGWVRNYHKNTINLMKIEGAGYYVKGVGEARKIFLGHVLLNCVLFLLLSGFLLMHAGLFLYLDWPIRTKSLLFLGLGVVYFLVALGVILRFCSQKKWMEFSGAGDMVARLTQKS
jgi:hypothetical protein